MDTLSKPPSEKIADKTLAGGGEMGRLMREHDWDSSLLGPAAQWPQSLRTAVSICLASQFPMLIWWGPGLVKLYNDAYVPILSKKHPKALGQPGQECWPEIWDIIGPMLEGVLKRGEATWSENQLLLLERNGYAEECYFTFSYSPIRDESGGVGGVFTAVTETTQQVLGARRLQTLSELAANAAETHTPEDICQVAARTLAANADDLPFALLYLLTADGTQAHLAGTAGADALKRVPTDCPPQITLADEFSPWPLARVMETGQGELVGDLPARSGRNTEPLLHNERPFPRSALVLPIERAGQDQPYGFLVAGISPRRLLDDEYRGFLSLVAGQIATSIGAARAYQEAQERVEALAALDRAKTAFFSNVSHEFRTPLTLSLGPLETVLSDTRHPLSDEQRNHLEMVRRNGLRQLKLVNTLLDFSRIEADRVEAVYEPTDLSRLTADLASAFHSTIEKAGLQLIVECAPLPEPIYVDRGMWEKIVLNLLSNAFKFTFDGFIRVATRLLDDAAELVVQDSGIGIREEDLPRLFERFYRVRHTQARTQEGSGIGLALVQELVRLHGGSIDVQSNAGAGTSFIVRLPRGSAHLPADRLGTPRTLASTAMGTDPYVEEAARWLPDLPQSGDAEPLSAAEESDLSTLSATHIAVAGTSAAPAGKYSRLLVVDDNADMRDYLKRLLSPSYHVLLAADGIKALALAQSEHPDLILSDVMMPGLDGFALLRALRANPATKSIPFILLSARAGEEATLEGLKAGANDYLVKPFSSREVLARVEARLEMIRLQREAEVAWQRLRDLFMQAPAIICVLRGPQHVFELANPRFLQLVSNRELTGKPVREAVPELEGQGLFELLDQVYQSGESYTGNEVRILIDRRLDGTPEEGYFNFVYQPTFNTLGEVDGVLVHAVEVTEQVWARQRMDAFLGMASHELKTPLTSIKGNLQLARRRLTRDTQNLSHVDEPEGVRATFEDIANLLERAERQASIQNRLVGDLIDISRIQADKLEIHPELTDLVTIVSEAIEDRRSAHPRRIIRLDLSGQKYVPIIADADRIGQVVTNFLTNALKYSEASRPVEVRLTIEDTVARVSVRDEGPGLKPEDQVRIWERFYRVPGVEVKTGSGVGLGLGLHISQMIIEEHGGTVGVTSTPGEGSIFWFSLPLDAHTPQE